MSYETLEIVREAGVATIWMNRPDVHNAFNARLIADLTGNWGMAEEDIIIDCLTFPISTGQEEVRRDGIETIEAIRRLTG